MTVKKDKIENTTVTRNIEDFSKGTGNIYQTVNIIARRANQIGLQVRDELRRKIEDFALPTDTLDEIYENREQIELARYYERLPKPTLVAINEFMNDEIYYANHGIADRLLND
ncbi:MAG: DNA-directed RNA polymerase subunit omega [Lentimicrobiaceae bacterium]|nr:DNA-directed RNA polymerase subunit omega [Lentimicrobiaceae bacterium]